MEFLKEQNIYDGFPNTEWNRFSNVENMTVRDIDIFSTAESGNVSYRDENQMIKETPDFNAYNINNNVNDGWNSDFAFEIETTVNGVYTQNSHNLDYKNNKNRKLYNEEFNINRNYNDYQNINDGGYRSLNETFDIKSAFDNVDVVDIPLFERINRITFENLSNSNPKAKQVLHLFKS